MKYHAIGENHLFAKTYAKGKRCGTRTVTLHVLADRHAFLLKKARPDKKEINRIGLTVGKKIGKAVVRSRTRRLLREAYRKIDREYGIQTGNLIVLVAREEIVGKKTQDVERDLLFAMKKLGLLKSVTKAG